MVEPPSSALCRLCRHFRGPSASRLTCDAFPLGIPRAVLDGRADHRRPYPGDDGIRFEPVAAPPAAEPVLAVGLS